MTQENIPLQPNEEIKPIQGYEDLYSITNFGWVWSHRREFVGGNGSKHKCEGKFLKSSLNIKGYPQVYLSNNNLKRTRQVHQLTAQHFIPNPQNLPEINHKDGDKQNNFAGTKENNYEDGNLEWCTDDYNKKHAMIKGLVRKESSEYYGITFLKRYERRYKPWQAQIRVNKRHINVGYFRTEIEAAQAYNDYILKHKLNRPLNNIEGGGILS